MAPLFVNTYKPPSKPVQYASTARLELDEPYDVNFFLPIPQAIETDRVKLVPFIPSIHAEPLYAGMLQNPNFAALLPFSFDSMDQLRDFLYTVVQPDPKAVLFAIIDKTRIKANDGETDGADNLLECMAGMIGVLYCSPQNLSVEIAPVVVLPAFQGTHVSKNAIGAMLKHWLDVPSKGGMGFRRVAWTTDPSNRASIGIAEKMGFKREGVMRWTWVLPRDKPGTEVEDGGGERGSGKGRDSMMLSICWDDWEGGVRERVQRLIDA
ncbi:hypothetical protein AX17_002298 [Amanita inopinata Kibby_2008]|nr:hypothetical protein AX17_002298 [Amanita inopinata Kibby_2008]